MGHPFTRGVKSNSGDLGYYGSSWHGVYVGTSFNYVAKYSNPKYQDLFQGAVPIPLEDGDEVDIVVLHILPGRAYQCGGVLGAIECVKSGYDSHTSSEGNEYWLPTPNQSVPKYIISVKAFSGRNSGNDDGMDDQGDLKMADVKELQEFYDWG